jgi:hypothetical protein
LRKANNYGFINHYSSGEYCDPDKKCAKKNASKRLKDLCIEEECQTHNPMGSYPYNMSKMNENTKGKKPKGYKFPE